jgi:hypothetical protein
MKLVQDRRLEVQLKLVLLQQCILLIDLWWRFYLLFLIKVVDLVLELFLLVLQGLNLV